MWARIVPPAYSRVHLSVAFRAFASPSAETELCRLLGDLYGRHAMLVDSGTSALTLALTPTTATPPDAQRPVALPAFGCYDLGTALLGANRRAILYDLDPTTLGPDWASVRAALVAGADTLVIAHLYGLPVDLDQARTLTDEFGAVLVEDAAQGVGGSWRGRPLGASGDLSILSFGRGKGLTGGGGGALLSRSPKAAIDLAAGGMIGSVKAGVSLIIQELMSRPLLYGLPASLPFLGLGATHYREPSPTRQMHRWSAQVLLDALSVVQVEMQGRDRTAQYLSESLALAGLPVVQPPAAGVPGWLRYPVVLPSPPSSQRMPTDLGIVRSNPTSLDELGPLRHAVTTAGSLSGARTLASRLVTMPTHRFVTQRDRRRMRDWLLSLTRGDA